MAYRIAVLDDDKKELHETEELFSLYGETHPQYKLEITCFEEIRPFMDAVCSGDGKEEWIFDILLMDVYLPDGNGIKSARVLREKGYKGVIIFKSSSEEHVIDSFSVRALQYLIKPVAQDKFFKAIEKAVQKSDLLMKTDAEVQPGNDDEDEKNQTDSPFWNHFIKWIQRKKE